MSLGRQWKERRPEWGRPRTRPLVPANTYDMPRKEGSQMWPALRGRRPEKREVRCRCGLPSGSSRSGTGGTPTEDVARAPGAQQQGVPRVRSRLLPLGRLSACPQAEPCACSHPPAGCTRTERLLLGHHCTPAAGTVPAAQQGGHSENTC